MAERITVNDILVEYTLECSQCGNPKSANGATSKAEAADDFNNDGWKVIEGELACPDCQDDDAT